MTMHHVIATGINSIELYSAFVLMRLSSFANSKIEKSNNRKSQSKESTVAGVSSRLCAPRSASFLGIAGAIPFRISIAPALEDTRLSDSCYYPKPSLCHQFK